MKIKKSLVEKIIKEEVIKIGQIMSLNEEKEAIEKELNELYEDVDVMAEVEELLSPEELQIIAQPQPQAQPAMEEGIGGNMIEKIKNVLNLGNLKNLVYSKLNEAAQKFGINISQVADELEGKFGAGASLSSIKGALKGGLAEGAEESTIQKIVGRVSSVAGVAGFLGYLSTAIITASKGSGVGLEGLQMAAIGLLATAVVSGVIYVILGARKEGKV